MEKPKIIMHNTVSLDSSMKDFEFNIALHYKIASSYNADAHLIGSTTAKSGLEAYAGKIEPEKESDYRKKGHGKNSKIPFWIMVDTKGMLKDLLHMFRRFDYCKEVIVLLSKSSPIDYVNYLEERNYEYIVSGKSQINFLKALKALNSKYKIETILTDTGGTLNSILLKKKLIDEISLVIAPNIVGKNSSNLFKLLDIDKNISLELKRVEVIDKNYISVLYTVLY